MNISKHIHIIGGDSAYIDSNGTERWYKDDKLHRLNGHAVIHSDKTKIWYINGERIFPEINLIEIPETEEEKLSLINQFKFVKINKEYILINEYLKRDERFYNKYKVLFE
jgi:hypothetical protein